MKLTQPAFWPKDAPKPFYWPLLWVLSGLYYFAASSCFLFTKRQKLPLRSLCIGNAIAGGAGKTPTLIALAKLMHDREIVFLTRGFGGLITEPTLVIDGHTYQDVGDEALLLVAHAPVIVAKDRVAGAKLASQLFPQALLLLDDGLQNPHFRADINILVWDEFGAGNGHMIAAGPLRLPLARTLAMTDMVICIGDCAPPKTPAFSAQGIIETSLKNQDICAFAGIARPEKFKKSLQKAGFHICQFGAFPDHHPFTEDELHPFIHANTLTLTTEKDYMRVPAALRDKIIAIPYHVHFGHPQALRSWIADHLP